MTIPIIGENNPILKKKVGVVVQCREKSTRLPGKWKADIGGFPMVAHVMDRCISAVNASATFFRGGPLFFDVCFAIPEGDSELKGWLIDHKCKVFEGSPTDVLKRYYDCAKEHNYAWVARITADCPLLDYSVAATIINVGVMGNMDYCSNTIIRTFPDGYDVEMISFRALQYLNETATSTDREHVTLWLLNPDNMRLFAGKYRVGQWVNNIDQSDIKISVDTQEELDVVRKEYTKIKEKKDVAKNIGTNVA